MKHKLLPLLLLVVLRSSAQTSPSDMPDQLLKNPLLCEPETGVCEIPGIQGDADLSVNLQSQKPVHILYFTDPICSSCWGIEPQLRRLKLEYGHLIDIEYRMGGLLPSWAVYNSGGISKPSDVAHHWDEVSVHYEMPIDGDVWLEDPLDSSYPPSIAFKAADMQDHGKALVFLRLIREMVFLEKKNIARLEHLKTAAQEAGLDLARFEADFNGAARVKFEEDLQLARQMGVRGFPTLFFANEQGDKTMVYGARPYSLFEQAVKQSFPAAVKQLYDPSWEALFGIYSSLTAKEFAVLSGVSLQDAQAQLEALAQAGQLKQVVTKNGGIWRR